MFGMKELTELNLTSTDKVYLPVYLISLSCRQTDGLSCDPIHRPEDHV